MNPWTTACGEDADALGLRRANGHWDETALKAHVRECPKCNEVFRVNGLPPFRELLGRLLPLVPAIKRRNVELVCTGCLSRGINRTLIESGATATPDRLVEIADAHRRDVHATSDRDTMIEPPGPEK